MWGVMNGWGYGGGFIWSIIWMIIQIALVIGAIYLIVSLFRNNRIGEKRNDAIEILRERYAKGEISEDEYLERKKHLEEK